MRQDDFEIHPSMDQARTDAEHARGRDRKERKLDAEEGSTPKNERSQTSRGNSTTPSRNE